MKLSRRKLRQLIYEALDQDKYEKLKSLIYSDDIESVIMGMNILSTFLDDSTGSNIDQQLYGLYNEIGNLYNDKRTELQSEIRELKFLLNLEERKSFEYIQQAEDYQRELGLQSRSDFMKTPYDMLSPHQKKYYDLWNKARRDYKHHLETISDIELQIEEKESQLAEFIQVYNNVFDSGAFRMSSDDGTSSVYIQDPVMESKKYINKKAITRENLRKIINEQLTNDQFIKLEGLLRSNDEIDLRQALSLVQTFLDQGGYEDYPRVEQLYYQIADEKNNIIQQKKNILSKALNKKNEISKRIMQINKEIFDNQEFYSHHSVIKLRKEMNNLLNNKTNILNMIDVIEQDLEKLLENYRIFEEFPIAMGNNTSSVIVQDPIMESKKYTNKKVY